MKKRIALLLAGVLAATALTACGGNTDASAKVKVGLGACTSFSESYSIGENHQGQPATATNAQVDIHVAAVTIGEDGKIVKCNIDAIQVMASVDEKGEIATDAQTAFISKTERGTDYNMAGYSASEGSVYGDGVGGIGKEWFEQAAAYEQWCEGKTLDEIKAGVGEDEYPTDSTLLTGCTIKTGDITKAVVNAYENAVETEASADDILGLAIIGELTDYEAPSTDKDGNAVDGTYQAYVNYATTTQNENGEITSVLIDSIQAYPTWDATGKLTTDADQDLRSKYTKKADYGMAGYSAEHGVVYGDEVGGIGKEWFEQIDVFKQSILGKKAADVTAIAVDEKGYPTDDTLKTGCTMKVSAYKTVVVKSLEK